MPLFLIRPQGLTLAKPLILGQSLKPRPDLAGFDRADIVHDGALRSGTSKQQKPSAGIPAEGL